MKLISGIYIIRCMVIIIIHGNLSLKEHCIESFLYSFLFYNPHYDKIYCGHIKQLSPPTIYLAHKFYLV